MVNHYKIALGGVAILALAITFALGRTPPPIVAKTEVPEFDVTWRDAAVPLAMVNAAAKPKFEERIFQPLPTGVEDAVVVRIAEPKTVRTTVSVRHRNVCERKGMRKVKHGRRGWRCRR